MDQGYGGAHSPAAVVVAECEVRIDSIGRHRRAVVAALEQGPGELCLDFTETRLFGSDGVWLLAEAAVCCHHLGTTLRVIESPAVRRTLELVDLTGQEDWLAHAHALAAHQPARMNGFAFGCAVRSMSADQLDTAGVAGSARTHPGIAFASERDRRSRQGVIAREKRRRRETATVDDAPRLEARTAAADIGV